MGDVDTSKRVAAARQLATTITKVATVRELIVTTQLTLFRARQLGDLSPTGERLHEAVEKLRLSIRRYR